MLRVTLKSLLSRKLRLLLSGLAVILAVMFVTGALVLSDTLGRTFDRLFTSAASYTDVQVRLPAGEEEAAVGTLGADEVGRIGAVPGVAAATGKVQADGARVIGHDGKVIAGGIGAAQLGAGWTGEDALVRLRAGRAPAGPGEVAVNAGLIEAGNFRLGETVGVLTLQPRRTFTIVGIVEYAGGRDSVSNERTVYFTEPVAQELMLGAAGRYTHVDVRAAAGQPPQAVRDTLRATLGAGYDVDTGADVARENAEAMRDDTAFLTSILLGFAVVALLVGVFLIINTFSIIVAQRTRELALFRALGARRGQMIRSVLVEALVIGAVSWLIGLGLGIGVGWAGAATLARMDGNLEVAGVAVPLVAVVASGVVGIGITVLAALLPAVHASRIAPIAAMRDAATPDRPLTRLTVSGSILLAAGGGALGYGLFGSAGDGTLPLVLAGVLACIVAVALLTPAVGRPVVSLLGRLFAWSVPGKLGRHNSARNPRRTAITAGAIMISVALVTGISTVLSSAGRSFGALVDKQVAAELIVAGSQTGVVPPAIAPDALSGIRALPGVAAVAAMAADFGEVNGDPQVIGAYDDMAATTQILRVKTVDGTFTGLAAGQAVVDDETARAEGWTIGSSLTVRLPRGEQRPYRLVGIFERAESVNGVLVSWADAKTGFRVADPNQAFVKLRSGAQIETVQPAIDRLLRDSPEVSVLTRDEWVGELTGLFDVVLLIVQVLLAVAMLIAVLGVVNTLVLSTLERTREFGMLRAIGLRRGQVMRMITVESMVISLFGALLGVLLGAGLGAAVVRALRDEGFGELALPWTQIAAYLVAAALVGVVAALIPGVRAARLNVLASISHN